MYEEVTFRGSLEGNWPGEDEWSGKDFPCRGTGNANTPDVEQSWCVPGTEGKLGHMRLSVPVREPGCFSWWSGDHGEGTVQEGSSESSLWLERGAWFAPSCMRPLLEEGPSAVTAMVLRGDLNSGGKGLSHLTWLEAPQNKNNYLFKKIYINGLTFKLL